MIVFVTRSRAAVTITGFVADWRPDIDSAVTVVTYESLAERRTLPRGIYIFSDLEPLSPAVRRAAGEVADQVEAAGCRALNHPRHVLLRHELLTRLARAGENSYRVFRLDEIPADVRYPVFVRHENEHGAMVSGLLDERQAIDRAVRRAVWGGFRRKDLIVTEFCDTLRPEGEFAKYGAFLVGNRVISRHLLFSRHWEIRAKSNPTPLQAAEEMAYMERCPHSDWVSRTCAFAGISYGRLDYGMTGDTPQVWEINTHPYTARPIHKELGVRQPVHRSFARQLGDALIELAATAPDDATPIAHTPRAIWRGPLSEPVTPMRRLGQMTDGVRREAMRVLEWMRQRSAASSQSYAVSTGSSRFR